MVIDPICGMEIELQAAATRRSYMGRIFYFCSIQCADTFDANPHLFVQPSPDNNGTKSTVGSATSNFNSNLSDRLEHSLRGVPEMELVDYRQL